MAEPVVSSSFWKGLVVVATITASTFFMADHLDKTIEKHLANFDKRLQVVEKVSEKNTETISSVMGRSKINTVCISEIIGFINVKYKKTFQRPSEFFDKPKEIKLEDED